ncbi:hypothetical protein J6590_080052 [Homalodisca vitripennis]|nr:hypothetical protein J6590_080052 [Homalodisca vitripennis]
MPWSATVASPSEKGTRHKGLTSGGRKCLRETNDCDATNVKSEDSLISKRCEEFILIFLLSMFYGSYQTEVISRFQKSSLWLDQISDTALSERWSGAEFNNRIDLTLTG